MNTRPPLTVVTSTYNWPRALEQAIPTALAQTFSDFEYLIIGDGCTDETEDLVRAFHDPRIIWRNLAENTGNQSGVNKVALEMARGECIAYLNHDDLWFPDHLDALIGPLRSGDLDIVNSLCIEVSAPGHHFRGILGMPFRTSPTQLAVCPMTSNVLHTASAAQAAGGWIDWRESQAVPTQDFFSRLRKLRGRFGIAPHVTSLKFHSGDRLKSYVLKEAFEQQRYADLMRSDPDLRYREVMIAMAYGAMGESNPKLAQPKMPANAPPGWQIEQWRRMRGLAPMLDLGASEPGIIAPLPASLPSRLSVDKNGHALISSILKYHTP